MTPKAIAQAAQALKDSQEAREKIAQALASYTAAQDTTEAPARELERLTREHQEMAAAAALGEVSQSDAAAAAKALETARKALASAREAAQADTAAREGLARRLEKADTAIEDAKNALNLAEIQWLRAEATEADKAYTEAAQAAWQAWTRVYSSRAALSLRGQPLDAMSDIQEPELNAAGPVSAAAGHATHPSEAHGWARAITPRHDPAAARLLIESELRAMRETSPGLVTRAAALVRKTVANA